MNIKRAFPQNPSAVQTPDASKTLLITLTTVLCSRIRNKAATVISLLSDLKTRVKQLLVILLEEFFPAMQTSTTELTYTEERRQDSLSTEDSPLLNRSPLIAPINRVLSVHRLSISSNLSVASTETSLNTPRLRTLSLNNRNNNNNNWGLPRFYFDYLQLGGFGAKRWAQKKVRKVKRRSYSVTRRPDYLRVSALKEDVTRRRRSKSVENVASVGLKKKEFVGVLENIATLSKVKPNEKRPVILIADDVAYNIEVMKNYMKRCDFAFETCFDGEDAMKLVVERQWLKDKEPFALIVLNCGMPWKNGFKTARELRALMQRSVLAYSPIIGFSANPSLETRMKRLNCGMLEFIQLPYDQQEIVSKVTKWVGPCKQPERESSILKMLNMQAAHKQEQKACALFSTLLQYFFGKPSGGV